MILLLILAGIAASVLVWVVTQQKQRPGASTGVLLNELAEKITGKPTTFFTPAATGAAAGSGTGAGGGGQQTPTTSYTSPGGSDTSGGQSQGGSTSDNIGPGGSSGNTPALIYELVTSPGIPDATGMKLYTPITKFDGENAGKEVHLVNGIRNMCMNLPSDAHVNNGDGIIHTDCAPVDKQTWTYNGKIIKNKKSGKCLTVSGGWEANIGTDRNARGKSIVQWDCGGSGGDPAQDFSYDPNTKMFKNEGSGKCLNLSGINGYGVHGSPLIQWDCVDDPSNKWDIYDNASYPPNLFGGASDTRYYYSDQQAPRPSEPTLLSYIKRGDYDVTPFILFPLSWLDGNKRKIAVVPTNSGEISLVSLYFDQNEPYLPMGDMMVRGNLNNDRILLDRTYVALCKNDPKFSAKISPADASTMIWRSRGCNWNGVIVGIKGVKTLNREYNNDTRVIGDFINFRTDDREWDATWYGQIAGNRWYAAPKRQYVSWTNPEPSSSSYVIADISGDYSCDYHIRTQATTAFHTFNTQSDEDTGGWQRNFVEVKGDNNRINDNKPVWPTFMYFELIPRKLAADCCAGTVPAEISSSVCNYWDSSKCKGGAMLEYCKGDNVLEESCYQWCRKPENDCSSSLSAYCQSAGRNPLHPNYKRTCSCFYGSQYYQYQRDKIFKNVDKSVYSKIANLLGGSTVRPECADADCMNSDAIKPYSNAACPSVKLQQCINNFTLNASGSTMNQTTLSNEQANNCTQN